MLELSRVLEAIELAQKALGDAIAGIAEDEALDRAFREEAERLTMMAHELQTILQRLGE